MNEETDIHNRILLALSAAFHPNGVFWRQNAGRVKTERGVWVHLGPTGISDIVGALYGRPVFVEVKTEKGKQRKGQKDFQASVERAGGIYIVARSPEEALALLTARMAEAPCPSPPPTLPSVPAAIATPPKTSSSRAPSSRKTSQL